MRPIIAILTDFGSADPYVAVMKAVMRRICPHAEFIDLSHNVEAQDLRQTAFTLLTSWRWFPPGTVFLIVVDPGVGSDRLPLAVSAGGCCFVAPDNGLLTWVLAETPPDSVVAAVDCAWHLPDASHTFHGRDIFAPLAAHLANGQGIYSLGREYTEMQQLTLPRLDVREADIAAEVLHLDRFGNLVTSLGDCRWRGDGRLHLAPRFGQAPACPLPVETARIQVGGHEIRGVHKTYGAVAPGTTLAYIGSSGFLELGINQGNAASTLDVKRGDPVTVKW